MKPVFAIMVTYRRFEQFKATVESLVPTLPQGSMLLIVDNASNDVETYKYLLKKVRQYPENIHVLMLPENVGWGAAMNEGLLCHQVWKQFEYVLETNNDVTYDPDWCQKAQETMWKYPKIGIYALWRHIHHGTLHDLGDVLVRDNAPAVAWMMRSSFLEKLLPFVENGPAKTRGGNGEDVAMVMKCQNMDYWVASPKEDLAHHMDGYSEHDLGKPNPAYD